MLRKASQWEGESIIFSAKIQICEEIQLAVCTIFTGYDDHTKDTAFTIGVQGIAIDKASEIEQVILETFKKAAQTGFPSDRVQAILNRTELSLKKQKNDFGWKVSTTYLCFIVSLIFLIITANLVFNTGLESCFQSS